MATSKTPQETDRPALATISIPPSSPRSYASPGTPTSPAARRLGIAVDLSDESAYAVKWAVQNYVRRGDAVILLHVGTTSVLYGADWGSIDVSPALNGVVHKNQNKRMEEELDAFTAAKARDLAGPLVETGIPFKIHIVKDHDMKERLCLEVERLGLSAMIMGSRGVGSAAASKARSISQSQHHDHDDGCGRLGSVSDYCVRHCCCPVVVVRYPDAERKDGGVVAQEEEEVYHDASNKQSDIDKMS